jgi:hypothetical protein
VSYLASPECDITGEAFSVCAGRFSRVFVGVASGWYPEDLEAVTAESVANHIVEIRNLDEYYVPRFIFDEIINAIDRMP